MRELTLLEAVREAPAEEMARDPRVIVVDHGPAVRDGRATPALTVEGRAVDGAEAGRFLATARAQLEAAGA